METPNLNYIKNISGGDLEFERKIIEIVQKELPEEIKTYENFVSEDKYKNTAGLVHKLKHKISILGLEESYEIAVEFEHNLLNESKVLQKEFEEILTSMINFINLL
jgi:HPt (histidine-containing phosphotransfer) domain-containing protein